MGERGDPIPHLQRRGFRHGRYSLWNVSQASLEEADISAIPAPLVPFKH